MSEVVAVVNPRSGAGRTGERWPELQRQLETAGLKATARMTNGPGDGTNQARQALLDGAKLVIAVGGDGTISEVANGFFDQGRAINPEAALGILPAGSGSDLIKTLGIPKDAAGAIAVLAGGRTRTIDLGRATYVAHGGQERSQLFINIASAGLSGEVIDRMARLPAFLGGPVRYNLASVLSLFGYQPPVVRVRVDGNEPREEQAVVLLAIGNGCCFGGGMKVCPEARLDDGELDLVAIRRRSLPEMLLNFPRLYAGTHLEHPMCEAGRGRKVELHATTPMLLEIDGEQPGTTPATFEVVPAALKIVAPD
jgi:YegS/Rv2252/BmrU family lipid kinase